MPRHSLRARLVALLVVLLAAGLAFTGVIATAALRGYLLTRVDAQLADALHPFSEHSVTRHGGAAPDGPGPRPPTRFYIQYADATGTVTQVVSDPVSGTQAAPQLPALTLAQATARANQPYTVGSADGSWRAVTAPLPGGAGSVTVAASLADVEATVTRLVWLELLVGLVVLACVGALADVLVRRSLGPLRRVETVAGEIASGDLARRVPVGDERDEVGQLALAFNAMVDRIETAFAARSASEAEARASEQRMRRFVADASHELRTPLTSIRGFAELYRQGAVGADGVGATMGRIEGEASRMALLVDDLLLLARLDQQRPLRREPVDLLSVATAAVQDARLVQPGRPVDLRADVWLGPPVVLGDGPRLRQVLANLLGNALRHTPPTAAVTVRVSTLVADDAPAVSLEVADDGPGMTAEAARQVFERFYRADDGRSREDGGTGLGLAIVAAIVAAHGGAVSVDTAPGEGATFRVRLPGAPRSSPDEDRVARTGRRAAA